MIRFAVVIPNLNQSRFLTQALESLRHQSVFFNLAVMDGGSVDDFTTVVGKYSDIINVLHSGADGGQAAAILDGMNRVEGDIVCWLNADDYYFPGALDKVARFFEENPLIDVVYGDSVHVKPDGAFLSYFPAIEEFDASKLPASCYICQPSCFVRRSAYDAAGGINPALKYTMDWDLWCRLAKTGAKFHYFHEVLSAVRCYRQTKTLSGDRRRYSEIWRIGRKYGKRMIPLPWAGFYLYDLLFKKETSTPAEKMALFILSNLRWLKKKMARKSNRLLYGFYPWENVVEKKCRIQIPWYEKEHVNGIRLQVAPGNEWFRVRFHLSESADIIAQNGHLNLNLPSTIEAHCGFEIESLGQGRWKLLDFSFIER